MMAATTAMMHSAGSSNQLSSTSTAPDSDSISDSGHSPLVVVEEQRSSSEDEMPCEKKKNAEELMVESELDDEDDDDDDEEEHEIYVGGGTTSSNGVKSSAGDESTEDEGTVVDEEQSSGGVMATSQSSLASLSSLINLKLNGENNGSNGSAKRSTGKLERITERLAKKQNGHLHQPEPVVTPEPSNDSKKDDALLDDDLLDEEDDDDDVKSGFRALGLAGNVAFMGDDAYKCPICGIKLDSQHTFTLHIRSHNPNDHSNTCSLCGKTLSSASSLDRHMLIHSGERPFKCTLCGMAFTTNGNMHRHMRTHGHGQIGYTPRGQKRRQKLLTQALEKMAAAAANGEEVDPEQINKLKKSILDTKSNIPIPSNSVKRKSAPPQATDIAAAMKNLPIANSGSIEAAAAAAVAAAAHKTKLNTQPTTSPSHPAPDALGLAGPIWPKTEPFVFPTEKAKPGRKKKNRMSYPLVANHTGASPLVPPGVPTTSAAAATPTLPGGFSPESFLAAAAAHQASAQFGGTRCPICTQPMRGNPDLHYHMSTVHPQEKLFCLDCGMILENYDTYTHHHCTASAASVMTALSQNPTIRSDLLFASTNTNRMNFSSARTAAMGSLFSNFAPGMANHQQQQQQQQMMAQQLSKIFGTASLPKEHHPAALASMLHDFQAKFAGPQVVPPPPPPAPPVSACRQCHRKFPNTKELKFHHETFCHQCDIDCHDQANLFAHQLGHHFSPAFDGDKLQVLKNAMSAFGPNLGLASQLISNQPVLPSPVPSKIPKSSTPTMPSASSTLDLSASSSLASLNSMSDMKPDLADIQSILSMVNGTAKATKLTDANEAGSSRLPSRSPISPNRASDAGSHNRSGGDATNQPDSPASADSAAGAVAASNAVSTTEGQHHTRTDLNHNDNETALCLKHEPEDDDVLLPPAKRIRSNSNSSNSSSLAPHQTITNGENGDLSEGKSAVSGSSPDMVRFRCEPCKLSFKSLNALRRHNRGHTAGGGHSHACHLCPYKSLDKSTLIRHLRTHNGERPFQCAICKYAFTTKANCERHVRKRHRNLKSKLEIRNAMQYNHDMAATAAATRLVSEKIFIERDELPTSQDTICKQCHADFGTNRDLRAHLRAPNNPCSQQLKPFVCTICKIGFNTRNNCVRHIIKQHPSTLSEEEAAEAAKAAAAEDSFMMETGSSSSLSPSSNPPMHSYGSMSSGSSEHLSECESYGTYDEEGTTPTKSSSYPNSSFAALCQVAEQVNGHRSHKTMASPLNLTKKADDTDDDDEDEDDGEFDGGELVLDLSCKAK